MYYYYPEFSQVNYPNQGYFPTQQGIGPMDLPQMPSLPPTIPAPSGRDEESYIENILRLNRGKIGTFYLTYENNAQWNAKVIRGVIETAGRDHLIVSDPQSGKRYLLLMLNLDYVEFDEPINYFMPQINPNKPVIQG